MRIKCPKCDWIGRPDELIPIDDELDEFELADEDNKEYKLNKEGSRR